MEQEQAKPASFNDSSILFLPTLLSLKKKQQTLKSKVFLLTLMDVLIMADNYDRKLSSKEFDVLYQ